jgi:sugar-specific transcriptional regulator TrmB
MAKINAAIPSLDSESYLRLTNIGLTKTQARCYALLQPYGLSATNLAERLGISRTNLYGSLKDLRKKGFITERHIVGPTKYTMVPLPQALVAYAEYQHHQVRDLVALQQQN